MTLKQQHLNIVDDFQEQHFCIELFFTLLPTPNSNWCLSSSTFYLRFDGIWQSAFLAGDVGRNFEGVLFRLMQPQELEQLRHQLRELAPWERELPLPSFPQQQVLEPLALAQALEGA